MSSSVATVATAALSSNSSGVATASATKCNDRKCTVCAKLAAFHGHRIAYSSMAERYYENAGVCNDDFLHRIKRAAAGVETDRLHTDAANAIADRVQGCVKRMQRELAAAGLTGNGVSMAGLGGGVEYRHHQKGGLAVAGGLLPPSPRSICGKKDAPMMAPFSPKEIVIGPVLGTGGFSVVYEVDSFQPDPTVSADFHPCETAARYFLAEHARREITEEEIDSREGDAETDAGDTGDDNCSSSSEQGQEQTQQQQQQKKHSQQHLGGTNWTVARYALKHLRPKVAHDGEDFLKASIDLVLEAQLLMVLHHPNIINIRGWSRHGTDAIRSGRHSDFFLIMDRIPETMEERMSEWRHRLRKYRQRGRLLPWCRARYAEKASRLFLERLKAAFDVAAAVEYLHDRRIVQRDIKTSNIGFDIRDELKLYDFGLARLMPPERERLHDGYEMSPGVGTKYYMAPEVRNQEPYDLSSDVYSFGVVLWEILSLCTPREDYLKTTKKRRKTRAKQGGNAFEQKQTRSMVFTKPVSGDMEGDEEDDDCWLPICPCWPDAIQSVIRRCLAEDPIKRPHMSEVRSTLHQQMEDLGMHHDMGKDVKRRRSTFRLDLSQVDFRSIHLASRPTSLTSSIGFESSTGARRDGSRGL